MTTLMRQYRVAAVPYGAYAPIGHLDARRGQLHAERAERDLRARLEAGEVPEVVLVSPERGSEAIVGDGGQVSGVWAWTSNTKFSAGWLHRLFVSAEVEASVTEPDPVSRWFAERGSVLVHDGVIRRLVVPAWLKPVAGQLAARYGVPVDVEEPGEDLPAAPNPEPGSVLARNVFGAGRDKVITELLSAPRAALPPVEVGPDFRPPRVVSYPAWEPWGEMIGDCLCQIGDALGLPVNHCEYAILEYLPGDHFEEHTDRTGDADTWDRTVSFSLLLNEPDEGFGGGEFEIDGEVIELKSGDLIGFTAATPHSVREITWGRRLVLVAFGEWRR